MELINTIEINPYDYADSDYEYPKGSSKEVPLKWTKFWKKCLADKNLENLKAIKEGSYLVDINSIEDSELKEILKSELKEIELDDYEEQTGKLCGGIVLKIDDKIQIEPTCCGDIGNIYEWKEMLTEANENWKQLWIGHPWVFYKKENDKIVLSDYYEANLEEIKDLKPILKIPIAQLKDKLESLEIEHINFEKRIRRTLEDINIKNSAQIAKLMTGNE